MFLTSAIFISGGYVFFGRQGLLWAFTVIVFVNATIYFYGDQRILRYFNGRLLEGFDPWGVGYMVQRLAKKARIPTPKVYIINSTAPQAFAVGRNWHNGKILLTQGLLESLSSEELEAIIAYEIATIKQYDSLAFATSGLLVGALLAVTTSLDRALRWLFVIKQNNENFRGNLITYLLAPFIAFVLRLHVSPKNYFAIDKMASRMVEKPEALAHAIWKMSSFRETRPLHVPVSTAHIFFINPLTAKGWSKYFCFQPNPKQRIKHIVGYYPI